MFLLAAIAIPLMADCCVFCLWKRGLIPPFAIYVLVFGGICSGSVFLAQLFASRVRPAAAIAFAGIAFYFTSMAWVYIACNYFGASL